jgi:putative two-component system response regulator
LIEKASQLHDLGMVAWRGSASGVVRAEAGEAEIAFPEHTEIGADLLADSDLPVLRMAADISLSHHERWDGTGFPRGLRGQETPLPGRIVAVALAYEARVRETGSSPRAEAEQQALGSIQEESGRAFDPAVVDALAATLATGAGTPSSP